MAVDRKTLRLIKTLLFSSCRMSRVLLWKLCQNCHRGLPGV